MEQLLNRTERVLSCKSLTCFLQGLEGHATTVELRNEIKVRGTVAFVDSKMNILLQDVQYTKLSGHTTLFDELFIPGRQIRYVQVPDSINVMGTIHSKVAELLTQRKVMSKQQMMKRRRVKNDEDRKRAREFKLGRGRGVGTIPQLEPLQSSSGPT